MNVIDLTALLHRSESETLDFKSKQYPFSSDEEKSELLKDILAFGNAWKDSDGYILIGVEEEHGRMKHLCGAEITLRDSDLQQFVNSKTNRPISFRIEVRQHEGVNLTVIQIDKAQQRPIFLTKNFGRLKSNTVYIRRGSSTDEAAPDEIADMGRDENAAQQEEKKKAAQKEKVELFWRGFKAFFSELEQKIFSLKNTRHIYDSTIVENRLPLAEAKSYLKQASEIDLPSDFCGQLAKLVEKVRVVDDYMDFGAEKLTKSPANFDYEKENLYGLAYTFKVTHLK
ncbi:MAG: ATP-binding protein [Verrucomicrobiales bacterium]|nr:ATP-binding protein [Verrucomicrobiales bacterium]